MPNIIDPETWQKAELLMQPILIRLIDHFRKTLENSRWRGDYQQQEIWADAVKEPVKAHRQQLLHQLTIVSAEEAAILQAELNTLPAPYPSYQLHLYAVPGESEESPEKPEPIAVFDLWQICYHICFTNYPLHTSPFVSSTPIPPAIVDSTLLDEEQAVDWHQVDQKTGQVVERLFQNLQTSPV